MISQSKLLTPAKHLSLFDSIPYTCYECAHPWTSSCAEAFFGTCYRSMKFSLRVYAGFYMLSLLLKVWKKENRNMTTLKKLLQDILRSSVFLSMNGNLFMGLYCVLRHILGKFYGWHGFAVGTLDGYISISIERKSRRGLLALYLANLASETLFNMAVSRNLVRTVPNGEVFIFILASAGFMALFRTNHGLNEHLRAPLNFVVGKHESSAPPTEDPRPSKRGFFGKFTAWLQLIESRYYHRHQYCQHPHSCLNYVVEGFLRNFVVGYSVQACINMLQFIRGRQKFSDLLLKFVKLKTCSLGLFVGFYNALFRLCNCILRWATNNDLPTLFGAISGAVAGFSSFFYKSTTISMYFLFKLIEVFAGRAVSKGWLPQADNADKLIYALSLGIVLQAAVIEPHHIRPGYWKFLIGVSGEKFPEMFRKLYDGFGTNASSLYPDYIPDFDLNYVKSPYVMALLRSRKK